MHSALFVVTMPERDPTGGGWNVFLGQFMRKIEQAKGVLRLAENVWLLDMTQSVAPLAHMIAAAENQKFAYGILPFDAAPQWLPAGVDPTTIRARNAI